ncbi:unnamed protein product [Cylicostephanus goldi]|uniref:Uncharacterized protein n=1 Tax=Cylicostephanus goldi TaxID=71465 RepID=A0A3P6QJ32_CYLGO|nr:unnamed protein product [Cylicostephanus goldi]
MTATVTPKETSLQYSTSTAFPPQNYGDCCSVLLKPAQLVVACGCNVIDRDTDPCSYALLYSFLDSCTVTTKGYGVGAALFTYW